MTDASQAPALPPAPQLTEESIERALLESRGDLCVASQLLGHVTVVKLDRTIRASDKLRQVYLSIEQVKSEYDKISQAQLEAEVSRRLTHYRSDALDSLHELAMMPIGDNSALAQVKFLAAQRLAAGTVTNQGESEIEATLRELNESYHSHAQRIKVTRERLTIEAESPAHPAIEAPG